MKFIFQVSVLLYASTAIVRATPNCDCLTDAEALDIATRWLHLWDTNGVASMSDLTGILAPDIASYDETFPPPIFGIQDFFNTVTAPGNVTTTDVKQVPLFVIHTCDQIATRWIYTGYSTGYSTGYNS